MKIGVISDTHGLLRDEVKEELKFCDVILHCGDINKEKILSELKEIAPLYAVRGNADKEWAEDIPEILDITLFGLDIRMIHNKKELPEDAKSVDLVLFGHSHKYTDKEENGVHFLNPGSCGPRRFHQPITMAIIDVMENKKYTIRKVDIAHETAHGISPLPKNRQDRRKMIETIIKDIDKQKSVERIALEHGIAPELAEQICRMYLTHPGVDIDGIMDRMG